MLTLPAPPIWQAFDHPLGCQASVATCGGSGPSSRRKRVVLLAKFYGYSVMWPWGDSFKGFHKQVWVSQSCTEESGISFSMSRSASFLHVQKTAVTFGQSRLRETGCWAMESEQLDAIFFQLYHLGCPPASGLDPFHSSARIYGPRVNRYPPSRDCWKAQSELWIHEKNVGVILQCSPSTYLSANPYIFIFQYIFHDGFNRTCGWDSGPHHFDDYLDAIIGHRRGEYTIRFALRFRGMETVQLITQFPLKGILRVKGVLPFTPRTPFKGKIHSKGQSSRGPTYCGKGSRKGPEWETHTPL